MVIVSHGVVKGNTIARGLVPHAKPVPVVRRKMITVNCRIAFINSPTSLRFSE
jgi:hypothetical protein